MCEKTIAFGSRQKDVRPSGWQCRPDAHNHGYYILNTVFLLDHLGGGSGAVAVGGNNYIHTIEGLVTGHAGHVDILHTSHSILVFNLIDGCGNRCSVDLELVHAEVGCSVHAGQKRSSR